jgi:2-dehydro-3-deoxygalactonokinase
MNLERYISGGWGTSRLRLSLCLGERILDARQGPEIGALPEAPERARHRLTAEWREAHRALAVVRCGMAGARDGWRETPYVPCPADPGALREASALTRAGCASLARLRTLWQP